MTRISDALRSNATSDLIGAPKTAPEGAHVLGEVPQNIRGLWLQRSQLVSEGNAVNDEIKDLEAKLAAAKKRRHTISRYLRIANDTIIVALDDKFGEDTPRGTIGMTADWQAYVESSDGIGGILKKMMGGDSISVAEILKTMPDEVREEVIPDGYEIVESLDELPDNVRMKLDDREIDDDTIVLYNKGTGDVGVMSMKIGGMGLGLGGGMPDFLKEMMGGEPGESRMAH